MVSLRKLVLLALDMTSTVLTLMAGMRENPVLVLLTGRYDHIRSRMRQRRINYNIVRDDHINITTLPDLAQVADSHRFFLAPTRTRKNLGEDRSVCMNVNSMSASVLSLKFDDMFGKGARREQIYVYSISTPHCSIINLKPSWYNDQCISTRFAGNASACHQFIFDNFDELLKRRVIQAGAPVDFGERGTPFLKCRGRPQKEFLYLTDLIVLQSYWAGGGYHIEVQTSHCWAKPLLRDADWQWGLFQTVSADERAEVLFAVEPTNMVARIISWMYGIVAVVMIFRGLFIAFSLRNVVAYVPSKLRPRLFGRFHYPSMHLTALLLPFETKFNLVLCRGENLMASDLWMNHWLYQLLSIAEAVVTVQPTYVILGMSSWMLSKQTNFENFVFVSSAVTKITWITCLVHTVFRLLVKTMIRVLQEMPRLRRSRLISFSVWYLDAVAMFTSYKLYAASISCTLLTMYLTTHSTSFQRRQVPGKRPVYGGFSDLGLFWRNEIVCDLSVLCSIQLVAAHVCVTLVLLTRYRRATYNGVLRIIQRRFLFVGWDAIVVMEALGIRPLDTESDQDVTTNCSLGALIQQLYTSGPSGLVEFVGDSVFLGAFEPESTQSSGLTTYPLDTAVHMGLCDPTQQPRISRQDTQSIVPFDPASRVSALMEAKSNADRHPTDAVMSAISQRLLYIYTEWWWGRILFVDKTFSIGHVRKAANGLYREFVVEDALVSAGVDDIRRMVTQSPVLHIS